MDSLEDMRREDNVAAVSRVGVLDKSVAILAFLAARGPATLAEVTGGTGLPRPTAHRLLSALEKHHLATRGEGGYSLGMRLVGWGNRAAGTGLVEASRSALERLREVTGESVQLYVREGEHRVCVASLERSTGLRDTVPVGAVLPLGRGSAGKVLLAWDGGSAVGFEGVRRRGWAESVAEREKGVASVSAPVLGKDGRIRAAVSASGPISRLGESPGDRLAGPVLAAAREMERAL